MLNALEGFLGLADSVLGLADSVLGLADTVLDLADTVLGLAEGSLDSLVSGLGLFDEQLTLTDSGKSLYVYARWANNSNPNKNGSFSMIATLIIS